MNLILKKVYDTVVNENMINHGDKILVGFSGGADSLFLMLALIELKKYIKYELYAAHLNHCIRGKEAARDEDFVLQFCVSKGIKLFQKKVNIPKISTKLKISEETAGRNERYKFFHEVCENNVFNKIAVAHNMNDSVETVILNMIRGSSLNGLCGIKSVNGNIIRPIIGITRTEIEEYLDDNKEIYCVDSTNLTDLYTRNKIRNVILKSMSDINPSVVETVYSNITNLKNDEDFICDYANKLKCISYEGDNIIINRYIFDKQHIAVKNRIILNAFKLLNGNCDGISSSHLSILSSAIDSGKKYNMPGNICVIISFEQMIFTKNNLTNNGFIYSYKICDSLEYMPGKKLISSYCDNFVYGDKSAIYIDADLLKNETLTVRTRADGDKLIPYGMKNNKKLKQLFVELKIPVYERDEIPLILDGNKIVAVVPYRISDLYKVTNKTKRILKIEITKEN